MGHERDAAGARFCHWSRQKAQPMRHIGVSDQLCRILFNPTDIEQRE